MANFAESSILPDGASVEFDELGMSVIQYEIGWNEYLKLWSGYSAAGGASPPVAAAASTPPAAGVPVSAVSLLVAGAPPVSTISFCRRSSRSPGERFSTCEAKPVRKRPLAPVATAAAPRILRCCWLLTAFCEARPVAWARFKYIAAIDFAFAVPRSISLVEIIEFLI